jgi:putative hemolysin
MFRRSLGCSLGLVGFVAVSSSSPAQADGVCVRGSKHASYVGVVATSARFCFEPGGLACYAADLQTGKLTTETAPAGSDRPQVIAAPDAPKVTEADAGITVCHHDGSACKTLAPKGQIDPGLGMASAVNGAGTLAALGTQAANRQSQVETFDAATGKHLATFKLPAKGGMCMFLAFAGDTLDITQSECGAPGGTEWLATRTGKKIAPVGGSAPINSNSPPVHVKGNAFAFAPAAGDVVVLQDVVTGKVVQRIAVGKAAATDGATLVGDGTHLVLVYAGARAGDLVVIDVATGKLTPLPARRC